ncbi:uncharacterized protein LOC119092251 [Pollicipes pollicipes]|uniref:uncharacterized protein LOC119092251 n=1 Tax=Pollicipes pollicipes TaxID=41117 RepID=UPI001884F037|nr:uncharacterized protein LOC119092251 [Pollicipes pollicipes]
MTVMGERHRLSKVVVVLVCDALGLPFRDESADAAVSVAVIHHLATTERRVRALRELARVLRIGGRLIVTVWAMEQRTRKFESQDVLVPWNQQQTSASEEVPSVVEPEAISTTSDDDLLNYSAFTHTSDSDSSRSTRFHVRRTGRRPRRIRSIDPTMASSSQSSSGLSSPSESCYSFVRRALQKLARRGEVDGSRPWILSPWTSYSEMKPTKSGDATDGSQLIEIRLDDDVTGLEEAPRRRNTLGCDAPAAGAAQPLGTFKSRSVGDMWSLLFAFDEATAVSMERSHSSSSALLQQQAAKKGSRKSVTFSTQSLTLPREKLALTVIGEKSKSDSVLDSRVRSCELLKAPLTTVPENDVREETVEPAAPKPSLVRQRRLADESGVPRVLSEETPSVGRPVRGILKQASLNENLMRRDRTGERDQIRAKIRKQQSLNENVIYGKMAGSQEVPKPAHFANYSRLRALRDNLGKLSESLEKLADKDQPTSALKNGLVKIVRQLTDGTALRPDACDEEGVQGPPPEAQQPPAVMLAAPCNGLAAEMALKSVAERLENPPVESSSRAPAAALPGGATCTRADRRTLYRYCSRERKTSREESSDSSKENSFQSDTSLDSEDSCVSVIYVPKLDAAEVEAKERSRSASSESSDGSNGKVSPKSPLTGTLPSSPTRLPAAPIRINTLKSLPKLGAQVLQSHLQGRFQLMDPPLGVVPASESEAGFRNVQIVRRAAPKYLTFEVFNPETDDLDSESSCASSSASSPSSACSVISMASDWPSAQEIQELDREIEQQQRDRLSERETANGAAPAAAGALAESGPGPASASHLAAPSETDDSLSSSPEPPARLSSPRGRRKVTMARLDAPPLEQATAAGEEEEGPGSRQASSEESLPSDVGGALGHHRYYHVFREGELDRLIEKYVDNLHIISSYYDHANWCVVAEKVQVWTI